MLLTVFSLPTSKITNPDVTGIINSSVIQAIVRPAKSKVTRRPWTQHKNPLVNKGVLFRLNPYAKTIRRQELREYCGILSQDSPNYFSVKQERIKAKKAKKPKTPSSAGKEFLSTLFAP